MTDPSADVSAPPAVASERLRSESRIFWPLAAAFWFTTLVIYTTFYALTGGPIFVAPIAFFTVYVNNALILFALRATVSRILHCRAIVATAVIAGVSACGSFLNLLSQRIIGTIETEGISGVLDVAMNDGLAAGALMLYCAGQTLPDAVVSTVRNTLTLTWFNLAFAALYFSFLQRAVVEEHRAQMLRLESLANTAQLSMLRFQLNPHFLFNTLSAITTLVSEGRKEEAESMLLSLSNFLRYTLEHELAQKVEFGRELEAQRLYLAIEKARFGDRLDIDYQIEPGLDHALVPALILQPLVENAVKHGVSTAIRGGCVAIEAARRGDRLELRVTNSRAEAGGASRRGGGVGLRNTRDRLDLMYAGRAALRIDDARDDVYVATIDVPLETTGGDDDGEADACGS